MNFTNQIDDELCKNIIENRDILLSSNPIEHGNSGHGIGIDFFSMLDNESEMNLVNLTNAVTSPIELNFSRSNSQPSTPGNEFTNDQLGIKDEIIGNLSSFFFY